MSYNCSSMWATMLDYWGNRVRATMFDYWGNSVMRHRWSTVDGSIVVIIEWSHHNCRSNVAADMNLPLSWHKLHMVDRFMSNLQGIIANNNLKYTGQSNRKSPHDQYK